MFEVFGEFDSAEEINKKAAELKAAGDEDNLKKLAVENGFEVEDAEDYANGIIDVLCSPLMAAIGKLELECKELGLKSTNRNWLVDVVDILKEYAGDPEIALGIRRKGKRLVEYMAMLISYSFEHRLKVPDEIVNIVKIKMNKDSKPQAFKGPLYIGIPDKLTIKKLALEYYVGKGDN